MAATLLKRTSAVWVPPRSTGERAFANEPCLIAMSPSPDGAQMRWSRSSLEALPAMKTTVLLFDARDVTLIPVKLPPLSGTSSAPRLDIAGATLEGVEVEFDDPALPPATK